MADFWARYDWSDPEAQKHLLPAKKAPKKEEMQGGEAKEGEEESKVDEGEKADKADHGQDVEMAVEAGEAEEDDQLGGVEWTKEGLEEILGTVGIQCSYNTAVSR